MSFEISQEYPRAILSPLKLRSAAKDERQSAAHSRLQTPTSSPLWQASTHIFSGTGNREVNEAWPPGSYHKDPSAIPDDSKYNIPYKSACATNQQSVYKMYDQSTPEQITRSDMEITPKLVAKRYIPIQIAKNKENVTQEGVTLLMLPGMGVPKEVSLSNV